MTALIRYKNHAEALDSALEGLKRQSRQPDCILGLNSGSTDGSTELLQRAGARILDWSAPYQPARVLNYGMACCGTDLIFILSAHVTLVSPDAVARLVEAACEPGVACASCFWQRGGLGESVQWQDLEDQGIPYSAIYTNVCGVLRLACWTERSFNEGAGVVDDYEWVLAQLRKGHRCRRVAIDFRYERPGIIRYFLFTRHVRALAHCFGLRFTEASFSYTVQQMLEGVRHALRNPRTWKTGYAIWRHGFQIFMGRLTWWPLVPAMREGQKVLEQGNAEFFRK